MNDYYFTKFKINYFRIIHKNDLLLTNNRCLNFLILYKIQIVLTIIKISVYDLKELISKKKNKLWTLSYLCDILVI